MKDEEMLGSVASEEGFKAVALAKNPGGRLSVLAGDLSRGVWLLKVG